MKSRAALAAENARLREMIAVGYQILGALGAPAPVLDAFSKPDTIAEPIAELLPFVP